MIFSAVSAISASSASNRNGNDMKLGVNSVLFGGHDLETALRMSLNQRLRAMVASTLTGALGALPMVVNPGPASTIYRGLAAVNVAGVNNDPIPSDRGSLTTSASGRNELTICTRNGAM